jgi:hypothetical protein
MGRSDDQRAGMPEQYMNIGRAATNGHNIWDDRIQGDKPSAAV